jgi:hypothetical protein
MFPLYEGCRLSSANSPMYTTQLQAGLGLVDETRLLLSLYETGLSAHQLYEKALDSGLFPMVSARRLRNIVVECFAPRYLKTDAARHLKPLAEHLSSTIMNQLFLIHTAAANEILQDFIRQVYWDRYTSGRDSISSDDAKDFVVNAVRDGKTQKAWSDSTIRRVSNYLLGCCTDYGLLSTGRHSRSIQPMRIQETTSLYLAYTLHFAGLGDNAVINHKAWPLFGLEVYDTRDELKRLAKNGWVIVQSAGDVIHVGWQLKSMEEVIDVIAQG